MTRLIGLAPTSARQLLGDFTDALDARQPVAVLDATWPGPVRKAAAAAAIAGELSPGEFAVFSSGSTDRPRGIVRTTESWLASVDPLAEALKLTRSDIVGAPGPLASSLYLFGAWHGLQAGCPVRLAGESLREATVVHAVPGLVRTWRQWPPAMHSLVLAGAVVPVRLREQAARRGVRVVEYYGSAEASFVLLDGRPFPGVEVRCDEQRRLWSKSPYAFSRYLDGGGSARVDGDWLSVGDLAEPTADGWRLLGRPGTLNCGGHTIAIADVEDALRGLDGVEEAVVFGVADQRLGQTVAALVQGDVDSATVRSVVHGLPAPAQPRRVLIAAELPRLKSGKLDRQACAQRFREVGLRLLGDD